MRYIYIHGFNSGPESRSGRELERLLDKPVLPASNDYSLTFHECLSRLEKFVCDAAGDADVCLMGTSLGGFYALQLRLPCIKKVAAWNPVIFPALQLAKFTGENMRFTDGQKWFFSRDALLSYAAAADPRIWMNFAWRDESMISAPPLRQIFLGDHDEVLDHEVSAAFWAGHAPLKLISSGHSIENFESALAFLK